MGEHHGHAMLLASSRTTRTTCLRLRGEERDAGAKGAAEKDRRLQLAAGGRASDTAAAERPPLPRRRLRGKILRPFNWSTRARERKKSHQPLEPPPSLCRHRPDFGRFVQSELDPPPRRRPSPPNPDPIGRRPSRPASARPSSSRRCRARPPAVELPASPRRVVPPSSIGYHSARLRPSDRWAAEITRDGQRFWLGTFESADLAARAYDVMVWRFDGAVGPLNFFDIDSLAKAEFVAPVFNVLTHAEECAVCWEYMPR
nr:uncharacterized protein LOC127303530 [Lolium perenne]